MKVNFLREHSSLIDAGLRIADSALIFTTGVIAYFVRFGSLDVPQEYLFVLLSSAIILLYIFQSQNLYQSWRGNGLFAEMASMIQATIVVFVVLAGIGVIFKLSGDFSRLWVLTWLTIFLGFSILLRTSVRLVLTTLRKHGYNTRSIIVVGSGDQIIRAQNIVAAAPWLGLKLIGYIPVDCISYEHVSLPKLGEVGEIETTIAEHNADQVWLTTTFEQSQLANSVLQHLKHSSVAIRWLPHFFDFQLMNHSVSEIDGYPILNLSDTPLKGFSRLVKWFEDKVLAFFILLIISPLMLVIAIGVKMTSKGPVFFKQARHGRNGQIIHVLKFRSMYVHDEGSQVTQATKNDTRITPIGAFLRRTSLDELPQFINVLQGNMSIVGPRPHAVAHNLHYRNTIDSYMRRHGVKPGITGWAQVNGLRGETDTLDKMERRVEADLHYINNWSLWLDLKIIVLTIFRGFTGGNAY